MDVLRRSLFVTGHAMAVDGGFGTINNYLSNLTLMNPIDLVQNSTQPFELRQSKATFSWKYCARELSGL
jgi:hypothetical protein